MKSGVHIGTSGWSYKHWIGILYPHALKPASWLSYYSQLFDISEINTSFYHLPKLATVKGWIEKVPDHFKFCPKISRYLTHIKRLIDPEEPLERFFEVFEPMKSRMGPVLVQLPPKLPFQIERAEHLYGLFTTHYKDYSFVMEVRHNSWLEEASLSLMAKYNIGLVISQSGNVFPYSEMITAKNIYIRFHGPAYLYASQYSDQMLAEYAGKISNWVAEGHEIWAFFNNDVHGYAIGDARKLMRMTEK
jgi:uncharacterized protein YecE (DUF72 family)